jgi:hypothetical protein
MTLITGVERRRRWISEERAQILAAIDEPGAVPMLPGGRTYAPAVPASLALSSN